jgi:hypothetical protein
MERKFIGEGSCDEVGGGEISELGTGRGESGMVEMVRRRRV